VAFRSSGADVRRVLRRQCARAKRARALRVQSSDADDDPGLRANPEVCLPLTSSRSRSRFCATSARAAASPRRRNSGPTERIGRQSVVMSSRIQVPGRKLVFDAIDS